MHHSLRKIILSSLPVCLYSGVIHLRSFTITGNYQYFKLTRRCLSIIAVMQGSIGTGAENLTKFLNNTLRQLIEIILAHGGDIVKFAGDAMIVIWQAEKPGFRRESAAVQVSKAKAAASACRCAMQCVNLLKVNQGQSPPSQGQSPLQRGTSPHPPKARSSNAAVQNVEQGSTKTLSIHVGVGVGNIAGFHVGGLLKRWEYFIVGEACNQMNTAEGHAKVGEVVISKATFYTLQDYGPKVGVELNVSARAGGFHLLNDITVPEVTPSAQQVDVLHNDDVEKLHRALRSYIPAPIVTAVDEGESLENDGVLRELCVLFIKLNNLSTVLEPNSGLSMEREADKIQRTVTAVQEAAYHGRATLRQFIIDDKGAVAIIVVGLPPVTALKNSSRGLKIGMRILEKGLPAQIGVTTGTCYCGTIGSRQRGDFAVVGDHINIAARLMSNAEEGSLLCDGNTMKAARKDKSLFFGEGSKLRVKGKKAPIKVYSPSRKVQSVLGEVDFLRMQRNPLIGNAHIWKTLQFHHHYRHKSRPQFVMIRGRKASGKTKIINTFQNMQKLERIDVMVSRADKFEQSTPYFVFQAFIYNIFELGLSNEFDSHDTESEHFDILLDLFARSTASSDFHKAAQADEDDDVESLNTLRNLDSSASQSKAPSRRLSRVSHSKNSMRNFTSAPSSRDLSLKLGQLSERPTGGDDDDLDAVEFDEEDSPGQDYESRDLRWRITHHPIFEIPNIRRLVNSGTIDLEMLALLNLISPSFEIPEANEFKELSLGTKETLLRDLIVELIGTIQNPAANISTQQNPTTPSPVHDSKSLKSSVSEVAIDMHETQGSSTGQRPTLMGSNFNRISLSNNVSARNIMGSRRSLSSAKNSVIQSSANYTSRPVTIFLDDFHNCDDKSVALLWDILSHREIGSSIMAVVTVDWDFEFKESWNEDQSVSFTKIALEPLSRSEISSVLFSEFSVSSIANDLMSKIHEVCRGNPGSAIDYLRKLNDLKMLHIDSKGGNCKLRDPNALEKFVSDDIRTHAMTLFDGIDSKSKYIVQLASVSGGETPVELLKKMYVNMVGRKEDDPESIEIGLTMSKEEQQIAMDQRTKVFAMRLNDLCDAKILNKSKRTNKVFFRIPGMAQVAYEVSLHSTKREAHLFTISWHESTLTLAELRKNSKFLYTMCLSVGDYEKATVYLYACCMKEIAENNAKFVLSLLTNSNVMLREWKEEILLTHEITPPINASDEVKVPETDLSSTKGADSVPLPVTLKDSARMRTRKSGMNTLQGLGDRRNSFMLFEEDIAMLEKVSIKSKVGVIESVMADVKDEAMRKFMLPVEYCEMRLRFFESQAFLELKEFNNALETLTTIIDFCESHGAKVEEEGLQKTKPNIFSRFFCNSVEATTAATSSTINSDSEMFGNSSTSAPRTRVGEQLRLLREGSMNFDVTESHIKDLYRCTMHVHGPLKQLLHMQETQEQVLKRIMQETMIETTIESPSSADSNSSFNIDKPSGVGKRSASRSPAFSSPAFASTKGLLRIQSTST